MNLYLHYETLCLTLPPSFITFSYFYQQFSYNPKTAPTTISKQNITIPIAKILHKFTDSVYPTKIKIKINPLDSIQATIGNQGNLVMAQMKLAEPHDEKPLKIQTLAQK
jgi:hypothetical protein